MKIRWLVCLSWGVAGALIVLAGAVAVSRLQKPKLYPLTEVLWLVDAQSTYYPPTSGAVSNFCDQLRRRGLDVDHPLHEPYVLIRTDVTDDMDAREWLMILNWHPKLFRK